MPTIVLVVWSVAFAESQVKVNHLAGARSPYLKRASGQPVDWYSWGPDAFQRAKELDRPLLLDVGAVWCPWCSVMDRDTYNNTGTAQYVNQHFVAVKVDFDQSPELAAKFERAQALLNVPVGLPMTAFITPEGKLYFGAGYLAAAPEEGKPSFRETAEEALRLFSNKSKIDEESVQLEVQK